MGTWPSPIRKLNRCDYCKHGSGFIFPETEDGKKAIQKEDGSWLCFQCQTENMIKMMAPKGREEAYYNI